MKRKWIVLITLILLWTVGYGLLTPQAQANIVLKTVVVNPSQTKTQTALLKAYLPKEVKPEDIVELGDLKVDYDIEKSLYYVYKECELAPGESISRSIEIKDVWIISRTELEALTSRAKELVEALRKTAYLDTAIVLQKGLEEKSNEVLNKQSQAIAALPQTHIAVYRDNVKVLDSLKQGLGKLEQLAIDSKIATGGGATGSVSVKATWWVILTVIVVLGLLSLTFFIIWHRQARLAVFKEEEARNKEPPRPPAEERRK